MTAMRRRARLSDDALDRQAPPLWRVWQATKANLVALLVVVLAFVLVGWLLVYNGQQDEDRDARQATERRRELCTSLIILGPDALARATDTPVDSPELADYRADLAETLTLFCAEFDLLAKP